MLSILHEIEIPTRWGNRKLRWATGDLTSLGECAVDAIVASARPGDYEETPGSLIGALSRRGFHVSDLAQDRAQDSTKTLQSWISRDLGQHGRDCGFRRIVVVEPEDYSELGVTIECLFRALREFTRDPYKLRRVAMPLLFTGDMARSKADVLDAIMEVGVYMMKTAWPLTELTLVEYSRTVAESLRRDFVRWSDKAKQLRSSVVGDARSMFLSYAGQDEVAARVFDEEVRKLNPSIDIFIARRNLRAGTSWIAQLYEAIERCRWFVPFFSGKYVCSRYCLDELQFAHFCRLRGSLRFYPVRWTKDSLPPWMSSFQYEDCTDRDVDRLRLSARELSKILDNAMLHQGGL